VAGLGDAALVQAALDDWRTAPLPPRLRATLGLLERLALTPEEVTAADVDWVRAVGVDDSAIEEAIHVCVVFSVIDRLADALDFTLPSAGGLRWTARVLLRAGYRAISLPG
jgi:alkylhydroperoxidase family enzyme